MSTSDERREVAKWLRYTAADSLGRESLQRALARIAGAKDTSWRGVLRRLADLIDPTCVVRMPLIGSVGVCLACGALVETRLAVFSATEALPTRYCPNCGARVVGCYE